jgi:hypothetical protein
METAAEARAKAQPRALAQLVLLSDIIAGTMLAFDLAVVVGSVLMRSLFNAPVEWSDDVARGLMVGSSFRWYYSPVSQVPKWPTSLQLGRY